MPGLADAPLLETRVCQYENTPDGHFLIDRLPGRRNNDRVWIVGGGSGHGFKHGPSLGRYVADLIESRRPVEPLFTLAGRPSRARTVY
jgi:glycine/D-amino acid oxidase-like deaminating enzyme